MRRHRFARLSGDSLARALDSDNLGVALMIVIITAAGRDKLLHVGVALLAAMFLHISVGMQNGGLVSDIAAQMGRRPLNRPGKMAVEGGIGKEARLCSDDACRIRPASIERADRLGER